MVPGSLAYQNAHRASWSAAGRVADMSGYTGYQQPSDGTTEFDAHAFVINQIIGKLATTAIVQVLAVTNDGGVSPVGFVDVQPMVNQVDGAGNPTPHATIHNLPYFRLQSGTNAVVVDPVVGERDLRCSARATSHRSSAPR